MDYSSKSMLFVLGGLLWALVVSVASFIVAVSVHHDLVPRSENGTVAFVVAEDHNNIIQWSAWIGFGIAIGTSIVATGIFLGSKQIRAQALAYYEQTNGFPFSYAAQAAEDLTPIGLAEGLLVGTFAVWVISSVWIVYLAQNLQKDETVNTDSRRTLCIGAQVTNALTALAHVVVTFMSTKDWTIVDRARVPQLLARVADASQGRQDAMEMEDRQTCESDEPTRVITSNLRQRNEPRESAGEETRPVQ